MSATPVLVACRHDDAAPWRSRPGRPRSTHGRRVRLPGDTCDIERPAPLPVRAGCVRGHRRRYRVREEYEGAPWRCGFADDGAECEYLDAVLADALAGRSRSVVLRGDAGAGKSALIDFVTEQSSGWHVASAVGIESEMELDYSGLHQLCAQMLDDLDRLPAPQRSALATVFGYEEGPAPDRLLVGLATLSLLADAADRQPLLCMIDDAHWLDDASAQIILFVARRLLAEQIALVCAARTDLGDNVLVGLPALAVDRSPRQRCPRAPTREPPGPDRRRGLRTAHRRKPWQSSGAARAATNVEHGRCRGRVRPSRTTARHEQDRTKLRQAPSPATTRDTVARSRRCRGAARRSPFAAPSVGDSSPGHGCVGPRGGRRSTRHRRAGRVRTPACPFSRLPHCGSR